MEVLDFLSRITDFLAAIVRLAGMIILGLGLARFSLEMFRKGQQAWQFQSFLYIGLMLFLVGAIRFGAPGLVGGLAIGLGIGFLMGLRPEKGEGKAE